jgi:hypothetical protein
MARLGKKILSAFIEMNDREPDKPVEHAPVGLKGGSSAGSAGGSQGGSAAGQAAGPSSVAQPVTQRDERFSAYFDKLFAEANIPGPDYYEFSKMTAAMQAIADEQSRYNAAYAGLQVQGLDREKLITTANEYVKVLERDAIQFRSTADAALEEKVNQKKAEAEEKSGRIQALSREISALQEQITALQAAIQENEEKITASTGGYLAESEQRKAAILADIEKIKRFIP